MKDLAFHFNAPDKMTYTCRLLRKATASGGRLTVTGPTDILSQLDRALWIFSATDFLPHCGELASTSVLNKTLIVLAEALQATLNQDVLINLGDQIPAGFKRFARIIEVVTEDDNDRSLARQRWKQYIKYGLNPIKHDLNPKAVQ